MVFSTAFDLKEFDKNHLQSIDFLHLHIHFSLLKYPNLWIKEQSMELILFQFTTTPWST
jgi:hypothetical protein